MAHTAIYGMTESGKSTLAKQLVARYQARDIRVIVLDPLMTDWGADYVTDDAAEFLRAVWRSRNCALFIDEAGESAGHYDKAMVKVATRSRHFGHNAHFIVQRANLISNTIRDQCSYMFLFASSAQDSKQHADEWNEPELKKATQLKQFQYYHIKRMGAAQKRTVKLSRNKGGS